MNAPAKAADESGGRRIDTPPEHSDTANKSLVGAKPGISVGSGGGDGNSPPEPPNTNPDTSSSNKDNVRAIILDRLTKICEEFDLPVDRAEKAVDILVVDEPPYHPKWEERFGTEDENVDAPAFILKHYAEEIRTGQLTQAYVNRCDSKLYTAFHNWSQYRKRKQKSVDIGFDFPPEIPKLTDEEIASRYGDTGKELLESHRQLERDRSKARRAAAKAIGGHPPDRVPD